MKLAKLSTVVTLVPKDRSLLISINRTDSCHLLSLINRNCNERRVKEKETRVIRYFTGVGSTFENAGCWKYSFDASVFLPFIIDLEGDATDLIMSFSRKGGRGAERRNSIKKGKKEKTAAERRCVHPFPRTLFLAASL